MGKPDTFRQFIIEHLTKERASLTIATIIGFVMAIPTHLILNMMTDWLTRALSFMCLFLVYMSIWHQAKDHYAHFRWRKRREEYADTKAKDMLVKLERRFQKILKRLEDRDTLTLAQRRRKPIPPELTELWTGCRWLSTHPRLPQDAKDAIKRLIETELAPRLGLYVKNTMPVEDLIRKYLLPDEIEEEVAG
jgi:hypothetical protein